jgi:NAD-dependent SIR2 family protein deacetylase
MKRKSTIDLINESENVEVMADIERILKEKGKGTKKQYLCSWMDGAEPQWVSCEYLEDTEALEEWDNAEEDVPEEFDNEEVVTEKCRQLTEWIRQSKRTSFLVGAGLSAPVLPTFRGKNGLWTRGAGSSNLTKANKSSSSSSKQVNSKPQPTVAHQLLTSLEKNNPSNVHWIASQNYDDLFNDCGFPSNKLSQLHGNIYTEKCDLCNTTYHRNFEVELSTSTNHETGRLCDDVDCQGVLRDNIIHFGESLPWKDLTMANAKFLGSELSIVLGSSLRVEPAASLPFKAKRRVKKGTEAAKRTRVVIVNLQPTPRDGEADLIIRAKCDDVMQRVADMLMK